MIKGIIFDLDGTTLSTLEDIQDSLNVALKEYGIEEKTYDEVRLGVGRGYINLVKAVVPSDYKQEKVLEIAERYKDIYSNNCDKKTKPYPGITELLQELQNRNIKIAINSNKSDKNTKNIIFKNFPGINFVEVFGSRPDVNIKPDPAGANYIIEKMNLSKDEVLYVGDSETDMATARNAGLKAAGCLWGFRDKETLINNGADIILDKPKDLLKYL